MSQGVHWSDTGSEWDRFPAAPSPPRAAHPRSQSHFQFSMLTGSLLCTDSLSIFIFWALSCHHFQSNPASQLGWVKSLLKEELLELTIFIEWEIKLPSKTRHHIYENLHWKNNLWSPAQCGHPGETPDYTIVVHPYNTSVISHHRLTE